jgi:hypothetical protein
MINGFKIKKTVPGNAILLNVIKKKEERFLFPSSF